MANSEEMSFTEKGVSCRTFKCLEMLARPERLELPTLGSEEASEGNTTDDDEV